MDTLANLIKKTMEEADEETDSKGFDDITSEDIEKVEKTETEENEESEESDDEKDTKPPDEGDSEEEVEKEDTEEEKKEDKREVSDELKAILEHIKKDETLKSRGLEVKVGDFTPEELKAFLQKGLRFYQAMEELAKERDELSVKQKALDDALARIESFQSQLSTSQKAELTEQAKSIPDAALEITEDDDPSTVALKTYLKSLKTKVDELSSVAQEKKVMEEQQALMREVEKHLEDYPLARTEEVLAVHFLSGGKVPIRKIMELSHKHYSSVDFVKRVFKVSPEVRKAIYDEMTKEYLAKTNKTKTPTKKVAGASNKVITTKSEKVSLDFDKASDIARKYLEEARRITKQEE